MRIGLVTDNLPCENIGGGIGTYTVLVAEELVRRGIETHIFRWQTPGKYETFGEGGITYHRLPKWVSMREAVQDGMAIQAAHRSGNPMAYPLIMRHFLKPLAAQKPFEVIEFPDIDGYAHAAFGLRGVDRIAVRLHGCSKLCRIFAGEAETMVFTAVDKLEIKAARQANCVTSVSQSALDATRKSWGEPLPKAKVVFNPVERMKNEKTGGERKSRTVFYSGRLEPRKGIDTLARAIPQIATQFPDVTFQIFGKDTAWSDGRRGSDVIREIVSGEAEVCERVQIPGAVTRSELLEHLSRATVVVVPSLHENQPFAVLEALASGTPLVVSDIAAHTEILQNEQQSLMFPVGDAEALARQVNTLLSMESLRRTLSENALVRSRDFEIGTIVDQLLSAWGVA